MVTKPMQSQFYPLTPFPQLPGGYLPVRQLDHGLGRASVWLVQALDPDLPRFLALKVTPGFRAMAEARVLTTLHHPGIPQCYDCIVGDAQGPGYLAMEYMQGETLWQFLGRYLNRKRLPPLESVLDLAIELGVILDDVHMHCPPIVCRNLRPAHVLRTAVGGVALLNFGCGVLLGDIPLTTDPDRYRAPEVRSLSTSFSPLSDIYSFGGILYTLCTGYYPPTDGDGDVGWRTDAASQAMKHLPMALRVLLRGTLAPDPRDRPQGMHVVTAHLREVRASLEHRFERPWHLWQIAS
jgi:serine/threonine protein kinase